MTIVSVRLPEKLLQELDHAAKAIHISRTDYIKHAIEILNKNIKTKAQIERLKKASFRVRKESIRVNKEFSRIDNDIED